MAGIKNIPNDQIVAGIDVGGDKKGFHAVIMRNGKFEMKSSTDPAEIVAWCIDHEAWTVAVDAPCRWSQSGPSRASERELMIGGQKIHCFSTPTKAIAEKKKFYGWVFNGQQLYRKLFCTYRLFDGTAINSPVCFETFPQAVACFLAGKVVSARCKATVRRAILTELGYDHGSLPNIDFVDAALCAVVSLKFQQRCYKEFGGVEEGFIIVPKLVTSGLKMCGGSDG